MQKMQKKQLYVAGSLAPLLELELEKTSKQSDRLKRRRKKRRAPSIAVKEDCSNEELCLILKTIDGNRNILRTSDGRRVRTKTLTVKRSLKERMIRQRELAQKSVKLKKEMFQTFINQANLSDETDQATIILPIEQALRMVEVFGVIQEEGDLELF